MPSRRQRMAVLVPMLAAALAASAPAATSGTALSDRFDASGRFEPSATRRGGKVETGSVRGVHYAVDPADASALFSAAPGGGWSPDGEPHWAVSCRADADSPRVKRCELRRRGLVVRLTSTTAPTVWIEAATVQVDNGRPVAAAAATPGALSPADSAKLLRQLRLGSRVALRQPARGSAEAWELHGFNEAFRYLNWALAHMR